MEQKYSNDDIIEERYDLCKECNHPYTSLDYWCQSCNAKNFQQNFKNWTSGNFNVDKLIRDSQINARNSLEKLEWIEYDNFENIEYVAKGGFGIIYKAIWKEKNNYETVQWNNDNNNNNVNYYKVALKSLNNSKDITSEFLNEIRSHLKMNNSERIVKLYGITKDSKTNDFMMVMEYANNGSLRQKLNKDFNSFGWDEKLYILRDIAYGLGNIHEKELTHQDFHSGNILNIKRNSLSFANITDLGLCKPANEKVEKRNKNVYGVLPYVAPEVLRGKEYMQASDVYSFGIIIYEIFNGLPPYYDMAHDELLAIKICRGLRPGFNIKVPQLIENIAKKCVDADPLKRPTAEYLKKIFDKCYIDYLDKNNEFFKQINEADKFNKKQYNVTKSSINTELIYNTHPQAIYASRLLKFNNLPEPINVDNNNDYLEVEYSGNKTYSL
ncbi:Rad53p [Rhizophagus irregularis DAOM 197198w]|uniref:Rad53p n=1 Tax=Rhizophagus irregularis (strain DAOM 197198w) TaxID=1432141 RepID=A0A015NJY0_RHIIW|nr:Rad53p [Rhizophagus irregularis DAOM 197198w]